MSLPAKTSFAPESLAVRHLVCGLGWVVRQRFAIADLVTTLGALCTRDQRHAPTLSSRLLLGVHSVRGTTFLYSRCSSGSLSVLTPVASNANFGGARSHRWLSALRESLLFLVLRALAVCAGRVSSYTRGMPAPAMIFWARQLCGAQPVSAWRVRKWSVRNGGQPASPRFQLNSRNAVE